MNGLVWQGQIVGHMLRVQSEGKGSELVFRPVIGLNFKRGNCNPDYREWETTRTFTLAQDAYEYGRRICLGSTSLVRND